VVNVLIFERTKEELRAGEHLDSAIEKGFSRAWLSIRDSNISSLITTAILFWFGSSIIKGFALTLGLGILVSMFTSIFVSRNLIQLIAPGAWLGDKLALFGVKQPKK
jgi:preprotein translocase subunit SecD